MNQVYRSGPTNARSTIPHYKPGKPYSSLKIHKCISKTWCLVLSPMQDSSRRFRKELPTAPTFTRQTPICIYRSKNFDLSRRLGGCHLKLVRYYKIYYWTQPSTPAQSFAFEKKAFKYYSLSPLLWQRKNVVQTVVWSLSFGSSN